MKYAGTMQLTTPNDREIVMTRVFHAPRRLVWDALTKPELVRQWMLGPPGWSMPVCEIGHDVGGVNRFVWSNADGAEMGLSTTIREIVPPERMVVTERFDQSWYPGEATVTNHLVERNGETTLTMTVQYESREARDVALKSPMEQGVAAGYNRLEELLTSMAGSAPDGAGQQA
jgi:uncharacterized protein YndB with AHSA1/START domain